MKVTNIIKINNIYQITFSPNWIQKLFGIKEKKLKCKWNGYVYKFGGDRVYIYSDGSKVSPWSDVQDELVKFENKF